MSEKNLYRLCINGIAYKTMKQALQVLSELTGKQVTWLPIAVLMGKTVHISGIEVGYKPVVKRRLLMQTPKDRGLPPRWR
jgi:hypothetical protein